MLNPPLDFRRAGWWKGDPRPGERGPAIIAGHVDSWKGPGVFWRHADPALPRARLIAA